VENLLWEQEKSTDSRFQIWKRRLQSGGKSSYSTDSEAMPILCKHPRVRIVSRHEDTEFVECMDCGEVFDSEEFRDMEIEETVEPEEAADDKRDPG
jgi:hypothetical protein